MRRRAFVALAVGAAGCSIRNEQPAARAARRGIEWLWNRQSAGGGWHSETYGLLRSGQSLTGFLLDTLLAAGAEDRARQVERAIGFLRANTSADGLVGVAGPVVDYPNYATALAAQALIRAGRAAAAAPMIAELRRQQMTESLGWKPEDAAYGAWGIGGALREAPYSGHVDLSMTRHVLEAFAAAGVRPDDPALSKARVFVDRCGGSDGGFHFSSVVLDANKAGRDGDGFRSYGPATADGILALRAMKIENTRAVAWLRAHHQPDQAPGFSGEAYARWPAGLRYYYASASSAILGCTPEMAAALVARQRADGSWANEETLVKEDDPLIATGFAVRALTRMIN